MNMNQKRIQKKNGFRVEPGMTVSEVSFLIKLVGAAGQRQDLCPILGKTDNKIVASEPISTAP